MAQPRSVVGMARNYGIPLDLGRAVGAVNYANDFMSTLTPLPSQLRRPAGGLGQNAPTMDGIGLRSALDRPGYGASPKIAAGLMENRDGRYFQGAMLGRVSDSYGSRPGFVSAPPQYTQGLQGALNAATATTNRINSTPGQLGVEMATLDGGRTVRIMPTSEARESMMRQGLIKPPPTAEQLAENRAAYQSRRGAEIASRQEKVEANAAQRGAERRQRLADRRSGPSPLGLAEQMAMRDPRMAMELLQLRQRGLLANQELASREAAALRNYELGLGDLDVRGRQVDAEIGRYDQESNRWNFEQANALDAAAIAAGQAGDFKEQDRLRALANGLRQGRAGLQGGGSPAPGQPQRQSPIGPSQEQAMRQLPEDQWDSFLSNQGISDPVERDIIIRNAKGYRPAGLPIADIAEVITGGGAIGGLLGRYGLGQIISGLPSVRRWLGAPEIVEARRPPGSPPKPQDRPGFSLAPYFLPGRSMPKR